MNNRHHPYGGYDERPTRGGRAGVNPSMRARPPRPAGISPPPSGYSPTQAAYNPAASNMSDASDSYQPQNAYSGSNDFAGGPDRRYQMPMSTGPQRGGMSARGGLHGSRPPPPAQGQNLSSAPTYGYTPASFENAPYSASNPYDQSSTAPAPGQPSYAQSPHQATGYSQDYNPAGGPPPPPRPPPPGFESQGYAPPPSFAQPHYRPAPPQNSYGRPPPNDGGPGFRGGRGGGRGGRGGGRGGRGGGFGGGGGRGFDDDEKPCRTLFVRSIQFETDSQFVQQQFEQFGQIKTFFDMVNKRGIAFITYYDLRSARDAMLAMKGALFGGRPINIHYSLPREEDKAQRCDREKNQGTLFTVLKGATQDLTDEAVHQVFGEFGDVKKVRDYPGQKNSRFVEYFDSRACQLAHDQLNGQTYLDGQWDLKFAWDVVTDEDLEWAQQPQQGSGPGFQAAPPGSQPGGWGRPGPHPHSVSDRAPLPTDYPSYDASGPPGGAPPSLGYGRPPIPPTGAPVDNGWGRRAGSGSGPASSTSASAPAPPADAGDANRLEQAQKVQALLASLGAASKPPPAAASSTPPAPAASSPPARSPPTAHTSAAPGLPPNIAALLQSAAGAPKPTQPPKPQSPPTSNASATGQEGGQQSVHQLLSMLNQNRPPRPS
ncbi:uncharacterized protein UTRI_02981 [Ustilago trichophora]|uniref:RRM domain-containing protein n=1 Tax=Ustilago trichophora TaxID=86804 RepID=A0A5C3EP35_9BASI|nr:uncharacterized protein UTRI_02981 [Ustilago trichophora]